MVNYHFLNAEEELFHIIRVNGSTFEDYEKVVGKIQNINYTDSNDSSFLHEAVYEDKLEIAVDLLRRGIDTNLQNVNGYTAAMAAESKENWQLLREILKYHPNMNLKDWRQGNTLLFGVVRYNNEGRTEMAKELLKMGANPYARNNNGVSPFDLVVSNKNQELIQAFQQIEKQEEDLQPFRVPKKGNGVFPLKMAEYDKYICVKDTTMDYLEEKIVDYSAICGGKKKKYQFRLIPLYDSSWILVCCPEKMDFFNYHNLMSWIYGLEEDITQPSHTVCVAFHKADERLSYYGIMDKANHGDRIVGRFQNKESFHIYLPESAKKEGNAKSYRDALPIKDIKEYLGNYGLDWDRVKSASQMQAKEMEVEMAV